MLEFCSGGQSHNFTSFKQCRISGCVGLVLDFITKWRDVFQCEPVVSVIYNCSVIKCVFFTCITYVNQSQDWLHCVTQKQAACNFSVIGSQVRHEQDEEVKQLSQLRDSLRTQLQVDGKEVTSKINTTPRNHLFF